MCFASFAVHKKQSKFSPFIRKYLVSITQEMKGGGGRGSLSPSSYKQRACAGKSTRANDVLAPALVIVVVVVSS